MRSSDQKCGCGNSNELVSLQLEVPAQACDSQLQTNETDTALPHYIIGSIQTDTGVIPQISTQLTWRDYLGAIRVRWGIRRAHYRVKPGLYAIGKPTNRSDVLVTANYKLTFDTVRKNLIGLHVWLLVLDTKGVNVWCSAGKGNFGTQELVRKIQMTSLKTIVLHRRLILPQLGATGVAAHLVKKLSGFTVIYGPVRASEIQLFIHAGYKATKEMRIVTFGFYDRLKLISNDLVYDLRYLLSLFLVISLFSGINSNGYSFQEVLVNMPTIAKVIIAGYISGIVLTPLLLPYIPTRNFSFKGFIIGAVISVIAILNHSLGSSLFSNLAGFFFISGFSSFLAMNFTGASTFTSLAGVKKEMRIAIPVQVASAVISLVLIVLNNFVG